MKASDSVIQTRETVRELTAHEKSLLLPEVQKLARLAQQKQLVEREMQECLNTLGRMARLIAPDEAVKLDLDTMMLYRELERQPSEDGRPATHSRRGRTRLPPAK